MKKHFFAILGWNVWSEHGAAIEEDWTPLLRCTLCGKRVHKCECKCTWCGGPKWLPIGDRYQHHVCAKRGTHG